MRGVAKNEQNNCSPFTGLQNIRHTISPGPAGLASQYVGLETSNYPPQPGILPLGTLGIFSRGPWESLASDWMLARDPDL